MGKKIFVSYKYVDDTVQNLSYLQNSTVRDYVNEFEQKPEWSDNIYKGESDGEDLSCLSENQIWEKLKSRIYDSSVTIVFISPNMIDKSLSERDQWIPWEVSYSLKETSRQDKNGRPIVSHSNAMIAVVLPDKNGSYQYYFEPKTCCFKGCILNHTDRTFKIIRDNMFNAKTGAYYYCDKSDKVWSGEHSYIQAVKWCDFIYNYRNYVENACVRQDNIDSYKITKDIE